MSKRPAEPTRPAKSQGRGTDTPVPAMPIRAKRTLSDAVVKALFKDVKNDDGSATAKLGSEDAGINIRITGVLPTGIASLDAAIGRGGIPYSRLTIITGPEGGGKTTLCTQLVRQVQHLGGVAIYMDTERKLDLDYCVAQGVDMGGLVVSRPSSLEQSFETMACSVRTVAKNGGLAIPILCVLDSIHGSVAHNDIGRGYSKPSVAEVARVMSRGLPLLIREAGPYRVAFVFVSQIRAKMDGYGSPEQKVGGGNAPRFFASLAIDVRRKELIKSGSDYVGQTVRARTEKNQIAPPWKEALYDIMWGKGIDTAQALVDQCVRLGLVDRSTGGWYQFEDQSGQKYRWQGRLSGSRALRKNPEIVDCLQEAAKTKLQRANESGALEFAFWADGTQGDSGVSDLVEEAEDDG